ncbi:hypothetical protein CHS0354_028702 [Potamilus streckersoni]|uniref:protein-tyrosine-phosphatase n=1 Tax=Potamilus streckersoni TaxID=2493646 RepID=A0AAE0SLV7_9BIVA|nr:hypothetical protein CHS0354_028702 [Potamilus streckersoni]
MNVMSWTAFLVITLTLHCHVASCLRNFAFNKSAKQSSTLVWNNFNWTADKAVDGNTNGSNPDESKTCSATTDMWGNHTWEVDIGFLIIVKTIIVYKRSDGNDQISGFEVFIGNNTRPWTVNQPLVDVKLSTTEYQFRANDSLARFVSVIRNNSKILTICEVVVDGECQKGIFGDVCNETCGNCLYGNNTCNSTNGQCIGGCQAGWRDAMCKEGCDIGTYGYGCNETCGRCFRGNKSCSAINGSCEVGCAAGWQGGTCKHVCNIGTFSYGCNETCGMCFSGNNSCSTTDGQCKFGCEAGWHGETCKEGCKNGTYSYGCNETCGMCFSGNTSCSTLDGHCKFGCEAGWRGSTCKQVCDKGTYGKGCNESCGSCFRGNNSCSSIDGHCELGCEAGWRGGTCKQECVKGTYGYGCNESCGKCMNGSDSCSTINGTCRDGCQEGWKDEKCILEINMPALPPDKSIIIGVVVPVVIVIVIVIGVCVILRVRRKQSKRNKEDLVKPNQQQRTFQYVIQEGKSSDLPQEVEEKCFPKDSVYQNTERKTQLMAQRIPVLSFWNHVMKKKSNKEECELDFQEFKQGLTKTHEVALANPSKNRYKSIYPYDFNRVVLKSDSTNDSEYANDSDYINASYIKDFEGRKYYIAAQGPITKTVDDFWWMIWQEGTECIVMLTNLSEMGKMKCIQYWPDKDDAQTYGDVTVKILRTKSLADCVRRDLQLTVSGKSRKVTQFHYTAWPDKDVPDTAWSLVEFWKSVKKHKAYGKGPMVVHCSAGVGRTGTFIALDIIYEEACETGHIAIMKCVENLREQRVNMVQTVNQFIFLHDVVAEALGFGTMPVFKKQFSDVLKHLKEQDERSGLTPLQRQYNILKKLDCGQEETNVPVYSNAEGFQSEIVWLPNLSGKDAYIAVKRIDDETLLATIRDRNIKCLIIEDSNSPKDILYSIGVNQSKTVAGLDITCKKREDLGAFERNQFSITSDGKKEPQKLTMFLLKTWEESQEVPSDSNSVLSLLEDIILFHPSPSEINPVLLYSRWELNRCSLVYILLNEKDRIRRDGEIHILRTSAEMLERSRKLLPTFEQYAFIYKCLATDALLESTYENTAGIMTEIL